MQAQDSLERMHRMEVIRLKDEPLEKSNRNSKYIGEVLDSLFARPIFSAKQLAGSLGMPFKTTRQYIGKLFQTVILREVTGNARNQIYRADDFLTLWTIFRISLVVLDKKTPSVIKTLGVWSS